jgi:hypothetical protein
VTADERDVVHLAIRIESAADRRALRGALLAARASELSEIQRRAGRLTLGYGSDTARESMSDEVANLRRRWTMLDRLIAALEEASPGDAAGAGSG